MARPTSSVRILLVDDHTLVRQGLRLMLEAQHGIEVVGEASDGVSGAAMCQRLHPDVVLLDLLMPGLSGGDTIQVIRAHSPQTRILVLSSSLEDDMIREAIRAGAHGYMLKASRTNELLRAIELVMRGEPAFDSAVGQTLFRHAQHNDPLQRLTEREREVFNLMARGKTNTELAAIFVVSEGTIRTHVANVLDKLQLRDRTQVMVYALKRGLVRIEDLA